MSLSKNDLIEIEKILKRKPTQCEEHIFDTMWSEHCSYKSSKKVLKKLPTKANSVALGIGEDAGIIRFHKHKGKSYCIAISHESHNHPSQILPIEGAATGVGGCVRDVYCMGADVIGVLNSLHFGIKNNDKQSLVEEIEEKVILGVADYGNPLGVPVLGGETLYHESYNDNCLVNVAALGLICEDEIVHSYVPKQASSEPYDVILFGKSTDQTGFGGASFSSKTLDDEDEEENVGAVQVHDPFLKRVLVEAIKKCLQFVKEENIEIGFKDLGAGGISCATSEIAVAGGYGVTIDLDLVNVIDRDLLPEVIACSETQERFCMAVPKSYSKKICDIFNVDFAIPTLYPNAGAYVIGQITQETNYVIKYKGKEICNLPVESITTEVSANRKSVVRDIAKSVSQTVIHPDLDIKEVCESLIADKLNVSKRYVYRHFDNAVKGNTVTYPGEADAVVTKPLKNSNVGLTVSMDSNLYGFKDPYVSGAYAVAESIRNLISVGATPIALTDCLNYGNPEKGNVFFDFEQGVQGIADAANQLSFTSDPIPIISGNVSFYNESTSGNAVIPSPVICAIGKVDNIESIKTNQFFDSSLDIVVIGRRYSEFGATQCERFLNREQYVAPQVRFEEEKELNSVILQLYKEKLINSCHDISSGGAWIALVEMVLGERGISYVGLDIHIDSDLNLVELLFSENAGFIVGTSHFSALKAILDDQDIIYSHVGKTSSNKVININHNDSSYSFDIEKLEKDWNYFNK